MNEDEIAAKVGRSPKLSNAAPEGLRVDSRLLDTDLSGYQRFWQGDRFTGTALELDTETGEVFSENEYEDSFQHGFYREWYEYPVRLKTEEHYTFCTQDGIFREWYPNGQLKEESIYEKGRILREAEWDENGVQTKNVVNE